MKSLWLVPPKGEPIGVTKTPTLVGRDTGADIVVAHDSISRRHAVLALDGADWQVADQKSANGTWIDGQRVIRAALRQGQSLRFGAVTFGVAFERPAPRAAVTPAPPPQPVAPEPARVTTAFPPPARAPEPAPAPSREPAAGAMSAGQAAELLGVAVGAPTAEIRRRYQKTYNDYQIRLTNAPTASLKRMYQKNLQELKLAVETLSPGLLSRDPE